jgi:hypothetical protein
MANYKRFDPFTPGGKQSVVFPGQPGRNIYGRQGKNSGSVQIDQICPKPYSYPVILL